jgi:hypothetical protein
MKLLRRPRSLTGAILPELGSPEAFRAARSTERNRIFDSLFLWHERIAGVCAMSEYSIYTITDEDRQFSESCTIVRCADDREAIREAARWVDSYDVEVWESNRFITRLHPSQMMD